MSAPRGQEDPSVTSNGAAVETVADAGVDVAPEEVGRPKPDAPIDPRAVRVTVAPTSRMETDPTMTIGPAPVPIEPLREQLAGVGILGGIPTPLRPSESDPVEAADRSDDRPVLPFVDGRPVDAHLEWLDEQRAVLVRRDGEETRRTPVLLGPARTRTTDGIAVREVVVDGWRIDIEVESERRAALRERARRGKEAAGKSGPLEVHAIMPGRIVAVSVAPGDAITAGQQLLVLEAMKMQNELRAPREGTIERIAISVGVNVEVGDLLMVIS